MRRWLSLRVPIGITITLGLILAYFILTNQSQLNQLRQTNESLLAETKTSGLNLNQASSPSTRSRPNARDVERIARDFMAYGVEFKTVYNDDQVSKLDQATRDRMIAQMDDITSLNQKELQRLIEIISAEPDFDPAVRKNLITFAFYRWLEKNRPAALDFFTQSPQLAKQFGRSLTNMVGTTLQLWVDQAPDEAIAWMRNSRDQFVDGILNFIIYPFARSIVLQRPIETFDLVNEFSEKPHSFFPVILQNNDLSIAQRTSALANVREMAKDLEDPVAQKEFLFKNTKALVLGQKNKQGDFQTAIDTIQANNLQPEEFEFIWNPAINDLGYYIKDEQTGQWISWLQKNIPAEKSSRRIKQLLKSWQRRDPAAAHSFAAEHQLQE